MMRTIRRHPIAVISGLVFGVFIAIVASSMPMVIGALLAIVALIVPLSIAGMAAADWLISRFNLDKD